MKNSINVAALSEFSDEILNKPIEGIAQYDVRVEWQSGVRALVSALPMTIGEHRVNRDFQWVIDEPRQLLGSNHAPSPKNTYCQAWVPVSWLVLLLLILIN